MIAFPATLGQLRDAVLAMIEAAGSEDAPVGCAAPAGSWAARPSINEHATLELIFIDHDAVVVGDEANDYRPDAGRGEVAAVRIS